jgi:hypothetical protein
MTGKTKPTFAWAKPTKEKPPLLVVDVGDYHVGLLDKPGHIVSHDPGYDIISNSVSADAFFKLKKDYEKLQHKMSTLTSIGGTNVLWKLLHQMEHLADMAQQVLEGELTAIQSMELSSKIAQVIKALSKQYPGMINETSLTTSLAMMVKPVDYVAMATIAGTKYADAIKGVIEAPETS